MPAVCSIPAAYAGHWLNPEPRNSWRVGDAEMRRYSAYCHQADECNSLMRPLDPSRVDNVLHLEHHTI